MSSTTSSPMTSVITRLDSSPVRRRIMAPTPLVLATRQSTQTSRQSSTTTEDEDRSTIGSSIQVPVFLSSPTKSTHSKTSVRSDRSERSALKRQVSEEYRNLMTDNVYSTTSASNTSRVSKQNESTRRKSRDNNQTNGEINSEMSSPKQCNRFGFFIDKDSEDVLP